MKLDPIDQFGLSLLVLFILFFCITLFSPREVPPPPPPEIFRIDKPGGFCYYVIDSDGTLTPTAAGPYNQHCYVVRQN